MPTYSRLPVTFERGEGACLWDDNGKQYLDAIAGIAVCSVGHAHPDIAEAIYDQAKKLVHTSNLYQLDLQQRLGEKLCQLSGLKEVFFSNSGAEANEAAIKLARRYASQNNIVNPEIIVATGSFHGRTLATLSATGNEKIKEGFAPLVSGFIQVPYNDIEAIKAIAESHPNVVAILVEPIQGEGGVNIPDENYLSTIRELCDQHNWLMMLDEIQTGLGRTGKWFAFQHTQIKPDVMTLAKALGNGVPIGACIAGEKAAGILSAGTHGSTFGGNPLACRAALTVIAIMEQDALCQQSQKLGDYFLQQFKAQLRQPHVKHIRGKGLMIGIELAQDCVGLVKQALEKGVLINVTAGNVIRLLPPLVISQQQADQIIATVIELIDTIDGRDTVEIQENESRVSANN
jgi:acetylornithine aminotransferase